MGGKKKLLSSVEFDDIIRKHRIRIEGQVLLRYRPKDYLHHFKAIDTIKCVTYETYKADQRIPQKQKKIVRDRTNYLVEQAADFLEQSVNESTWRDLEPYIFERFNRHVICTNCHGEIWKPYSEADLPNHEIHRLKQAGLKEKRRTRKDCACGDGTINTKLPKSKEECDKLFAYAKEEEIRPVEGDTFGNISIPMSPDRVIGLRPPRNMPYISAQCPFMRKKILLPFMVIEAKKEANSSGFREIQQQTAFPIRRLLKAQKDFFNHNSTSESCLVWFFAYRGEAWRLYASILEKEKVRIYEMWQGSINGQDHALQLLLIIDYVWSWARDLYRPAVMKLLSATHPSDREFSPASTVQFRQSVSLSCTTSPINGSFNWDHMQIDQNADAATESFSSSKEIPLRTHASKEKFEVLTVDASLSPFLRWSSSHQQAPDWTKYGSICHSNIIHFEVRLYQASTPDLYEVNDSDPDNRLILDILSAGSFRISSENLFALVHLWTGIPSRLAADVEQIVHVAFFFQTYCDQSTWQIKRVLHCVICPSSPAENFCFGTMKQCKKAISSLQQIYERDSVFFALGNVDMVFGATTTNNSLDWAFKDANFPDKLSSMFKGSTDRIDLGELEVEIFGQYGVTSQIDKKIAGQLESVIEEPKVDSWNGEPMIAVGSTTQAKCSKFCLFILSQDVHADTKLVHKHLDTAISLANFYGMQEDGISSSDWETLRQWRDDLQEWLDVEYSRN